MSLPLRLGSRGDDVKQLQAVLGATPDGSYGEVTQAAVRSWPRARGLAPDGVVGPATWAAMEASLQEAQGCPAPDLPEAVIALLKKSEGFRAAPYLCLAGIATMGYGATFYLDGRKVTLADMSISEADAAVLLPKMASKFAADIFSPAGAIRAGLFALG
ncbi:MAG: hypothetical protein JWR10_1409 [Rubritepida sp.]|nr:hypothetical protein [Rubritepida sp.]